MPIDNLPEDEKDIINLASKTGYLTIKTEFGEIKPTSYNEVEMQPKGTPFGAKVKVEENGDLTPMLTFDTKKLRDPKKDIDPKQLLDDALEDFWNEQN